MSYIEFHLGEDTTGKSHAKKFLSELDTETAAKIAEKLDDYQTNHDLFSLMNDKKIKKIEDDLYSVRMKVNGDHYRLFGKIVNSKFYIGHIIKKKSKTISKRDKKTARSRITSLVIKK